MWFIMNSDGSGVQRLIGQVEVVAKAYYPWRAVISQ